MNYLYLQPNLASLHYTRLCYGVCMYNKYVYKLFYNVFSNNHAHLHSNIQVNS